MWGIVVAIVGGSLLLATVHNYLEQRGKTPPNTPSKPQPPKQLPESLKPSMPSCILKRFCRAYQPLAVKPKGVKAFCAAALAAVSEMDSVVAVKLSIASGTGKLDLSDLRLTSIPPEVFAMRDLEELMLAGNELTELPTEIGQLGNLKKLGLQGNCLTSLPTTLGQLSELQGLWLHGNLLEAIPAELGQLSELTQLSLAGNKLTSLPDTMDGLVSLDDLAAAGNLLASLPASMSGLRSLRRLSLHGNRLQQLPSSLADLTGLRELSLMGNRLEEFPEAVCHLGALQELSVADNQLLSVPRSVAGMTSLQRLWLYGNRMPRLPQELLALPSLQTLWLEANPLEPGAVAEAVAAATASSSMRSLGLDTQQVVHLPQEILDAAAAVLKVGQVAAAGGHGYFKLQPGPPPPPNLPRVLVVAFGSAPGLPNWGGLLGKAYKASKTEEQRCFDVLYVVDPARCWYGGGDGGLDHYWSRLQAITDSYDGVIMLGDSMGATAALMFSPLATNVLAFCPQVDLWLASIRPGESREWLNAMHQRLLASVEASQGSITVLTGTFQHDLDQVNLLPQGSIHAKVFSLNSHRLALAMDSAGKLLPVVQDAIAAEMGLRSRNVRLQNML